MQAVTQASPGSRKKLWAGWIISALPVLLLLFASSMKLTKAAPAVQGFAHFGYSDSVILGIGIIELACAVLYVVPRTAVLGAILVTGFLGGATATHVRIGEPFVMPVLAGVLVWIGIYLREDRLRALLPLRK